MPVPAPRADEPEGKPAPAVRLVSVPLPQARPDIPQKEEETRPSRREKLAAREQPRSHRRERVSQFGLPSWLRN